MDNNEVLEGTVVDSDDKRTFKDWWNDRKSVKWLKDHPDVSLTLLGGVLSIIGAAVKIVGDRKEYDDSVFITASDDSVYKLPAKQMKTVKQQKTDISSVD